jgi:hypothetical protein
MSQLEMSDEATESTESTESTEATQDAITGAQPTLNTAGPPVLVTEHEVMFGTAAAAPSRVNPITRRLTAALHIVAEALRPPPPKPHYGRRAAYIERAAMSREMDRL